MIAEVQNSIAGHSAEPTSVDTGQFLNSVPLNSKFKPYVAFVKSDLDYAGYLEGGTTKISGRHHFENSLARNKTRIIENIKKATM